jgi:hypothetical protein
MFLCVVWGNRSIVKDEYRKVMLVTVFGRLQLKNRLADYNLL